ncbi:replicative DNA helicase [candidate division CSSED10-310 bacterium]|uniref:Replicative DNA helicase n=1 Tax=candidate division CSSED10-310 bacterium TaxID=2855610 RepID=A0ABV6YW44_UNCC1
MADSDVSKPLPHNIEAERAVLGALLLDNDSLNIALELIVIDDFYLTAHSLIYSLMIDLYEMEQSFDVITLTNKLNQEKKLKSVGGAGYLASLLEAVPTAANIAYHAEIVAQKSLSRQVLTLGNAVVHECYDDSESISSILDRVEKQFFDLGERRIKSNVVHIKEVIKDNFDKLDKLYQRQEQITGIPSGFSDLDELTSGFQNSDLIIVAARPSVGKTSFLLNVAEYVTVREKKPALFFSLEMSNESVANRLLCSIARIDSQKMRTGFLSRDDWSLLKDASDDLYKSPLYIDDTPGMTVLELRAKARRMKALHNIQIIFVDYLQLMKGIHAKPESRQQEISQISGALKALAKELDIPVLVCSQLSRDIEKRREKEPKLSDLRESGSIEQDGDVIGFLHRASEDEDFSIDGQSNIIQFVLGKQRNGPTGIFKLVFIKKYTRFQSMSRSQQQPPIESDMDEEFDADVAPF